MNVNTEKLNDLHEAMARQADAERERARLEYEEGLKSRRSIYGEMATGHEYIDRELEMLPSVQMHTRGLLYFPREKWKPGFTYKWQVEFLNNEAVPALLQKAYFEGWRPAPASDHPEFMIPDIGGATMEVDHRFIRVGGLILMRREERIGEASKQALQRAANEPMDRVRQAEYGGSAGRPKNFYDVITGRRS